MKVVKLDDICIPIDKIIYFRKVKKSQNTWAFKVGFMGGGSFHIELNKEEELLSDINLWRRFIQEIKI